MLSIIDAADAAAVAAAEDARAHLPMHGAGACNNDGDVS